MRHLISRTSLVAMIVASVWGFAQVSRAQDEAKTREPGGGVAIIATDSATVKAIDPAKRIVTLQKDDGTTVNVKCGEDVRNFDQIKVGDQVKAAAIAKMVVAVGKSPSAGAGAGSADAAETKTVISRAPKGAKPGAVIAKTETVTAKVDAVDPDKQTVTLSGLDDQPQTIKVSPDVDLSSVKPGDQVAIQVTKGMALWVTSPDEAQPAAATDKPDQSDDQAGAFALEGKTRTATVESIDPATRTVTLKGPMGKSRSIHLGKECVNFDQIKVGDQVRATLADEVAIAVNKSGGPPSVAAGAVVALAPKGAKPGMLIADTDDVTAKIQSIDADKGTITFSTADGTSRTVKAGPDVKLSDLKEGDDVTARITQALAIVVEKP
jgi:Cu/Ag efflux protein CusF